MKQTVIAAIIMLSCFLFAYRVGQKEEKPVYISPSKQRSGDASKGFEYLVTGDYVKSGIPFSFYKMAVKTDSNDLGRQGLNKNIPYSFTAVTSKNGEAVIAPNCLQCHAQFFEGKLIVGLGNSFSDYTANRGGQALITERILKSKTENRTKYEASKTFIDVLKIISNRLVVKTRGVNIADHLAGVLVAHRDPVTFKWSDSALMKIRDEPVISDVPPWWLLKKKNGMFYNGFGRGDFGRFLMASNLLTVTDTAEAREVDSHFNDVLAYILSIKAPVYPGIVNQKLAGEGKALFVNHCADCHGTYDKEAAYPNLLIPETDIQTDPLLFSSNYSDPKMVEWFNKSWFTTGDHPARLVPFVGYIAPPLDGIWVTAPYLHNGSVPNLEGVLNSRVRPKYWTRDFNNPKYDYQKNGWTFREEIAPGGSATYDTTIPGYGNQGHYYGNDLSDEERKAIMEYLKTL